MNSRRMLVLPCMGWNTTLWVLKCEHFPSQTAVTHIKSQQNGINWWGPTGTVAWYRDYPQKIHQTTAYIGPLHPIAIMSTEILPRVYTAHLQQRRWWWRQDGMLRRGYWKIGPGIHGERAIALTPRKGFLLVTALTETWTMVRTVGSVNTNHLKALLIGVGDVMVCLGVSHPAITVQGWDFIHGATMPNMAKEAGLSSVA